MEQKIKLEQIKCGDKVIRADGTAGKVISVQVTVVNPNENGIVVKYENGRTSNINLLGELSDYYLIGTTILGYKSDYKSIEQQIEANKKKLEQIKSENAQLRKQAWRLRNVMIGVYPLPKDKKDGDGDGNS